MTMTMSYIKTSLHATPNSV